MSQIDKVIYLPLLSWYWVLFIVLYFVIFTYFLGSFFYVYRVRALLFFDVLASSKNNINFMENFSYIKILGKKKLIKLLCSRH